MKNWARFCRKPLGQVLLATLFFCFIFAALFVGLYKVGTVYLLKERSAVSTNMTALTAGAIYANGLQQVRYANTVLMVLVGIDAVKVGMAMAPFMELPPPFDAGAITAAQTADMKNLRTPFQDLLKVIFGIDQPSPGAYPLLIEGQTIGTSGENQLSTTPFYFYNHETADTFGGAAMPNMALRFRRGSELMPDQPKDAYSLLHNGERHYFSSNQVEPAHNPRFPHQMRVKKISSRQFGGMWVRYEKNSAGVGLSQLFGVSLSDSFLKTIKEFMDQFKLDVIDRDDPPCHTFALLSVLKGRLGSQKRDFYQTAEVRVNVDGLASWDSLKPIDVSLEKVDLSSFRALNGMLEQFPDDPALKHTFKSSDILGGL